MPLEIHNNVGTFNDTRIDKSDATQNHPKEYLAMKNSNGLCINDTFTVSHIAIINRV